MKRITAAAILLVAAGATSAKEPQAVAIGGGKYMMTDRNMTIFGSADGIIVELIDRAHAFCAARNEGEAEVLETDGANPGPGRTASGTIYFKCATSPGAKVIAFTAPGRFLQVEEGGNVTVQLALPTPQDCGALATTIQVKSGKCSAQSASDRLPARAILEDPADRSVIVLESLDSSYCESVVTGMVSTGSFSTIQSCITK